jgi:hypothetical protein
MIIFALYRCVCIVYVVINASVPSTAGSYWGNIFLGFPGIAFMTWEFISYNYRIGRMIWYGGLNMDFSELSRLRAENARLRAQLQEQKVMQKC